ncbi:Asp-tRNA(Asn)/Glu-tRNA(Gln) amidotransferase subunit GatC [Carnobacterium antarcticum]|uniref:Aspartyl/glutamyl-tRNA(Asn/Gln) amidotransferase subunit C n=1 Tax=Carnobacterium antarcticum TaxID=2126436 RepID=A0ABW4NMA2_9LACT|nr:Asp-tRNA(Asn)/Glu-tRNA(Gln) amidotransferase subunit GatC [Carnobacterium sp. CP1]
MMINEENVKHVALLAKLEFQDEEITRFTQQIDDIINMVEQLEELDTTDVPVTTHGLQTYSVMRKDVAVPGTDREKLFENVKSAKDGLIKVPAMIDNGEAGA